MSNIPKYADEAIFPQPYRMPLSMNEAREAILPAQWGLTKREYTAIQVAAGICASSAHWPGDGDRHELARRAVIVADALLAELVK